MQEYRSPACHSFFKEIEVYSECFIYKAQFFCIRTFHTFEDLAERESVYDCLLFLFVRLVRGFGEYCLSVDDYRFYIRVAVPDRYRNRIAIRYKFRLYEDAACDASEAYPDFAFVRETLCFLIVFFRNIGECFKSFIRVTCDDT